MLANSNVRPTVSLERLADSINRIKPAEDAVKKLPEEVKASIPALKPSVHRFHGAKIPLYWFPLPWLSSACADRFGYMSSPVTRALTRLPFNVATQNLLDKLGNLMGDPGRDPNMQSNNPADAGVSTFPRASAYGQFVDHDITLDVLRPSTLRQTRTINNMRSPSLDLTPSTAAAPVSIPSYVSRPGPAVRHQARGGDQHPTGPGGRAATALRAAWSRRRTGTCRASWDAGRRHRRPAQCQNLIIVQLHAMRFHNAVVDMLVAGNFAGDISPQPSGS